MIFAFAPVCFSAQSSEVFVTVNYTDLKNVTVTFWGTDIKNLKNASFAVNYNSSVYELISVKQGVKTAEGTEYDELSGMWALGKKKDGSGAAAGFVSTSGASRSGTAVLCEFKLRLINENSPNGTVSATVEELFTDDKNIYNDIYAGNGQVLFEKCLTEPLPGDINGDGVFDALDLMQTELCSSGHLEFTKEEQTLADVNGDGSVTYRDFYLMFALNGEKIREYDLNGDGVLDAVDLTVLDLSLAGHLALDEKRFKIADADCDGELTAADFSLAVNEVLK